MMKLFKLKLIFLSYFLVCQNLFAQQISAPVQVDIFPPAPNAASLGKFGAFPVSLYTGTPQISIPIWEIQDSDISVPVSLNYHTGGIQVQEIASWVGLGWALNGGGVISRSVRGLPDDLNWGFLDQSNPVPLTYDGSTLANERFINYAAGFKDCQPDLFSLNFSGRNGKFQMGQDRTIYLQPFQKLKIVPSPSTGPITKWTVTAENGFIYEFDILETSRSQNYCTGIGNTPPGQIYTSSWYLSKITSPKGAIVTLEYDTGYTLYYPISSFENKYAQAVYSGGGVPNDLSCTTYNDVRSGVRLKKIKCATTEVEFVATENRYDLPGDKRLNYITIKDYKSNIIRKFKFGYKYMLDNALVDAPAYGYINDDAIKYRLALVSLQETDPNESMSKPPYQFFYKTGLPNRLSCAVDIWGYYNGQTQNTTMIQEEFIKGYTVFDPNGGAMHWYDVLDYFRGAGVSTPTVSGTQSLHLEGGNRLPYNGFVNAGAITKIKYPTGGETNFEFELNTANQGIPEFKEEDPAKIISKVFSGEAVKENVQVPFQINSPGQTGVYVRINVSNIPCDFTSTQPPNSCDTYFTISPNINGSPGTPIFHTYSLVDKKEVTLFLTNGNYFLANGFSPDYNASNFQRPYDIEVKWRNGTGTGINFAGGIRIKKMEDYDPVSKKKIVSIFEYKDDQGNPSGRINPLPPFGYYYSEAYITYTNTFFVRTSTPNYPVLLTQGSPVGYKQVNVYKGVSSSGEIGLSGKTSYKYTSCDNYPDLGTPGDFPFPPSDSRDWMRGSLLEQIDYRKEGQNYIPVKKIVNTYTFYEGSNPNVKTCIGLKVGTSMVSKAGGNNGFSYRYFNFTSGYKELIGTSEINYDNDITKFTTKGTKYTYSQDHLQLVKSEATLSNGRKLVNAISYPSDYLSNSDFIQDLKTANIINVPIEKVLYETESDGSNERILSGEINTYKTGGKGLKDAVYLLETVDPISLANFRFSNRSTSNVLPPAGTSSAFYLNTSLYTKRFRFDAYDSKGNILQYSKDGVNTSVIWGYNNLLPIAEAKNASRGSDLVTSSQIAYNGFEAGVDPGEYGWSNVMTSNIVNRTAEPDNVFAGNFSFRMDKAPSGGTWYGPTFNLTPPSPQRGKYKLSCWVKTPSGYTTNNASLWMYTMKKNTCCEAYPNVGSSFKAVSIPATNNTWMYVELIIDFETIKNSVPTEDLALRCFTANGDVNYPVYIDELKICPLDAQITTYSHLPLVGLISKGESGRLYTKYEYDPLGRLLLIRDSEGNINKRYQYHYKP